jgi:hypothetical protein
MIDLGMFELNQKSIDLLHEITMMVMCIKLVNPDLVGENSSKRSTV